LSPVNFGGLGPMECDYIIQPLERN